MKNFFMVIALSLFTMNAFALSKFEFHVVQIECSGVPDWIQFDFTSSSPLGSFKGSGIENYLNFELDCKISSGREKITCSSATGVSAEVTIDQKNIVTATFRGKYHTEKKIGCIARM